METLGVRQNAYKSAKGAVVGRDREGNRGTQRSAFFAQKPNQQR